MHEVGKPSAKYFRFYRKYYDYVQRQQINNEA